MKWTEAYEETGRTVVIAVRLFGKEHADGWIFKSKAELEEQTGVSQYEQDTCRKNEGNQRRYR
jgi:hypothetical protein